MIRLSALVGVSLLGVALLVGGSLSQDKGKDKEKIKGILPPGFKALNLSKDQVLKVYEVQSRFREKIKGLEEQIKDLKSAQKAEEFKVLTKEQQEAYLKAITGDKKKDDKDKDKK